MCCAFLHTQSHSAITVTCDIKIIIFIYHMRKLGFRMEKDLSRVLNDRAIVQIQIFCLSGPLLFSLSLSSEVCLHCYGGLDSCCLLTFSSVGNGIMTLFSSPIPVVFQENTIWIPALANKRLNLHHQLSCSVNVQKGIFQFSLPESPFTHLSNFENLCKH